jgi:hypothetical protein
MVGKTGLDETGRRQAMNMGMDVGARLLRRAAPARWPLRRAKLPLVTGTVGSLVAPLLIGALAQRRAGAMQKRIALGASAIGAAAVGALAIGALSIGALAIGRLAIRSMRIAHLRIDRLEVRQSNGTWLPAAIAP